MFRLERSRRWLLASFSAPQEVLSWAVVGGGRRQARTIAWHQVARGELSADVDPERLLQERLAQKSLPDAVGLMTGRSLDRYVDLDQEKGGIGVRVLATVGLGNALAVGDPPRAQDAGGTINLLCWISQPLEDGAMIESSSIVTEARTAALLDLGLPSPLTGRPCTGTGTDCIVVACPVGEPRLRHAGKHSLVGYLVGAAVRRAVARGAAQWLAEERGLPGTGPG